MKASLALRSPPAETVGSFRFYDNRQKYLMFVNTCSEKWVVAERVARELDSERTSIGTSTLLAAWNAATYVAQIDDDRLETVMGSAAYLDATRSVLRKHGELWFNDESYVIARDAAPN